MSLDVMTRISQAVPELRPSERRVAQFVMDDPGASVDLSITELAAACNTSIATVVRFCQAAGFAGYGEFRLELASIRGREEVSLERFGVSDAQIDPDDDVSAVLAKIAYHEATAIESTAASVDPDTLDAVVDAIVAADRIDIFGVASSGLAALDLQQKLHRIGLISFAYTDVHLALTSAALLTDRSLSIGFSHSGRTTETADSLVTAQRAGATTIAVTNFGGSPIAEIADHVLLTSANETRYRPGAMSGRIAQLAVVDFLFVRTVQRRYGAALPSLQLTYDAVQAHRMNAQRPTR